MLRITAASRLRNTQDSLISAVVVGGKQAVLPGLGVVGANVGDAFSVGREGEIAVNIVGNDFRSAARELARGRNRTRCPDD